MQRELIILRTEDIVETIIKNSRMDFFRALKTRFRAILPQ